MAIFKKLSVGATVATSGTRVFKKLTTEDPTPSKPVWNGADLTGRECHIPRGWTAEAGYGVFYVAGTAEFEDQILATGYSRLDIGYDTENAVFDGNDYPAENTILVRALGYHIRDNTKVMAFRFESGQDLTNTSLINWLLENGELTSHTYVPVTAGLYDANDNLVASWDELVNTYGMDVEQTYALDAHLTSPTSPYSVFTNNSELANGTKLIIDDSITGISVGAFGDCTKLTSIYIPDSVTYIGNYSFMGCTSLVSIVIPDSVWTIEPSTFRDCTGLSSVTIGNCVEFINWFAFDGCTNLTDVYYRGTEEQWNAIDITDSHNEPLLNATIHYNYTG